LILVADPDEDTRALMRTWLERHGLAVIESATDHGAVALALQRDPDLILATGTLPGVAGVAIVRSLRASGLRESTPIIYLAAATDAALQQLATEAGVAAVVQKPVDLDRLFALIHGILSFDLSLRYPGGSRGSSAAGLPRWRRFRRD
jgi:DNA-binding response OmpR family regulator